ncbi:glycosyltransferase [Helicobacter didelphidarum]|uniref:Glycosyltransferase n=1 Tax=Helicobacter didelphidarum TaxID=2040648 RepID=A0A3D8IFF2_9HELI|nr:tetratricopeptide repeat protein [Helicobacter didelphidarum]RDU63444.1 glycosyltransferase [Helicobacter didelphidarum]
MDITLLQELFDNGKWHTCIESCLRMIAQNRTNTEIWSICALSYGQLGKFDAAIECLQEAIKIDKMQCGINHFPLSLNLAEFYRRNNMTLQAIALLKSFLPRDDENLHFNLAKCYGDLQDYEQSIKHYTIAIQINPKDIHAMFNLANQEAAIGRFQLALKYYTLAYEGGMGDAGMNLAQIYTNLDRLDEAINLYQNLESYYTQDSNFYFNYANALRYDLKFDKSQEKYYQALSIHFDARYAINLSYLLLSLGDFENGFLLYEHRKTLLKKNFAKHFLDFSFQNKAELLEFLKDKKVAIYHEQGFGDSIMFARFLPLLVCKEKILYMPRELQNLFACFDITCSNKITQDYDVAIPLPSLGFLFANEFSIQDSLFDFRMRLESFLRKDSQKNIELYQAIKNCKMQIENTQESLIDEEIYHLQFNQKNQTTKDFRQDSINSKFSSSSQKKIPVKKILNTYEINPTQAEFKHDFIEISQEDSNKMNTLISSKNSSNQFKSMQKNHTSKKNKINTTLQTLSHNQAYKLQLATMNGSLPKKLKVGLNFASNPNFQNAREKSIYPQKLLESLPKENFEYYSLQYEGIDSDLVYEFRIIDLKKYITDFSDTARILQYMDIVISIDSALAHLSTSLGIPTALLLYKRYDWRWGELGKHDFKKDSTIWYPSISLFIQQELNDWGMVLTQLQQFLHDYQS